MDEKLMMLLLGGGISFLVAIAPKVVEFAGGRRARRDTVTDRAQAAEEKHAETVLEEARQLRRELREEVVELRGRLDTLEKDRQELVKALEHERQTHADEVADLREQLKQQTQRLDSVMTQYTIIVLERDEINRKYAQTQRQLGETQKQLAETQTQLDETKVELQGAHDRIAQLEQQLLALSAQRQSS